MGTMAPLMEMGSEIRKGSSWYTTLLQQQPARSRMREALSNRYCCQMTIWDKRRCALLMLLHVKPR